MTAPLLVLAEGVAVSSEAVWVAAVLKAIATNWTVSCALVDGARKAVGRLIVRNSARKKGRKSRYSRMTQKTD